MLSGTKRGVAVRCTTCGLTKKPVGRSAPIVMYYCEEGRCHDYRKAPRPGSLWPGETEVDFGYSVGGDGTTEASKP